jgi:hypothetical protein
MKTEQVPSTLILNTFPWCALMLHQYCSHVYHCNKNALIAEEEQIDILYIDLMLFISCWDQFLCNMSILLNQGILLRWCYHIYLFTHGSAHNVWAPLKWQDALTTENWKVCCRKSLWPNLKHYSGRREWWTKNKHTNNMKLDSWCTSQNCN